MSRQIAGFITEWDQWGRFRVTFPRVRNGTDTMNTEAQFRTEIARAAAGWCPVKKKSYLAKPSADCFAYMGGVRVTFDKMVQRDCILEVDFLPFAGGDPGWWIRVASVRCS